MEKEKRVSGGGVKVGQSVDYLVGACALNIVNDNADCGGLQPAKFSGGCEGEAGNENHAFGAHDVTATAKRGGEQVVAACEQGRAIVGVACALHNKLRLAAPLLRGYCPDVALATVERRGYDTLYLFRVDFYATRDYDIVGTAAKDKGCGVDKVNNVVCHYRAPAGLRGLDD